MENREYDLRRTDGTAVGGVSFWLQQAGIPTPTDALDGDYSVDFCIVGGGLTGLWTAYYLSLQNPDARIAVLEREFAGFGASGRNAGWLSSEFAGKFEAYAKARGPQSVKDLAAAMRSTVDEVLAVCASESVDMDAQRDGVLRIARNPVEEHRLRESLAAQVRWGVDAGHRWLDRDELGERLAIDSGRGAVFNEFGARINPAKMVRGVLELVRRRGVRVHENTEASRILPGRVHTDRGIVSAPVILRCLEGYTAGMPGARRELLPMNSSLIVTEVLPDSVWEEIGWSGAELIADGAQSYACAQRTLDGRIAFGGRGMLPGYRIGSRSDHDGITTSKAIDILTSTLHEFFPAVRDVPIDHAWCGVLGVPRDWTPSISFDPSTGLGSAGGYVGSGVSTTNLAGRILRDLVSRQDTELTRLPWVGHRVRNWEIEPVRWLGVRSMYLLFKEADRREASGRTRSSRLSSIGAFITGR
jgi:glycine/D-amino acid oxidase-like deaminating enzyme